MDGRYDVQMDRMTLCILLDIASAPQPGRSGNDFGEEKELRAGHGVVVDGNGGWRTNDDKRWRI